MLLANLPTISQQYSVNPALWLLINQSNFVIFASISSVTNALPITIFTLVKSLKFKAIASGLKFHLIVKSWVKIKRLSISSLTHWQPPNYSLKVFVKDASRKLQTKLVSGVLIKSIALAVLISCTLQRNSLRIKLPKSRKVKQRLGNRHWTGIKGIKC